MMRKFLSLDLALCLLDEGSFEFRSFILYTFIPTPKPIFSTPNLSLILFDSSYARINPTSAITAFLLAFALMPIAAR